jgi:hypothetical protein
MVPLTYIHDNSEQLNLVQETPTELCFQYNKHQHHSAATRQKRTGWISSAAKAIPFAVVALYLMRSNAAFIMGSTFPYFALLPLIAVGLLSFLSITYLSPHSVRWFFNSETHYLTQTVSRFLWPPSRRSFSFESIRDVVVKQKKHHRNEHRVCVYILIVLASGKEIKLSQSGFFTDAREKAIALKHHQDIAQKMRERIGLKNSAKGHDTTWKVI